LPEVKQRALIAKKFTSRLIDFDNHATLRSPCRELQRLNAVSN